MSGILFILPARRAPVSLRALVAAWRQRRRSRITLAHLDDHLLADIGVRRDHADVEAAKHFWND